MLAKIEGKNPTQTDIVEKVGISYASLHRHIELLLKFKIIKVATDGGHKRYLLFSRQWTRLILALFRNYYSNSWIRWSEGLTEMFLPLSEDDEMPIKNFRIDEYRSHKHRGYHLPVRHILICSAFSIVFNCVFENQNQEIAIRW